jgi:hypothetical protein
VTAPLGNIATALLQTQRINEDTEGVTLLLHLLEQPDTLVPDNTTIDDFKGGYETLSSLGIECKQGDFLWQIAQRNRRYRDDE